MTLRTLVIDTATAACSVALIEDDRVIDHAHAVVGRGHAERLVPMIAALSDGGRADAILVDCGPGSFTGIRVGIAAARGLGIGWGIPVGGYASTALIAALVFDAGAESVAESIAGSIAVVLEGGHGEVFVQGYDRLVPVGALASLTPAAALVAIGGRAAFGNGVRYIGHGTELLPDARAARWLPAGLRGLPPAPIYGRAPDAKPMAVL